ncbi:MAG: C39 family peptidase [Flexilinea sp.]
MNSDKDFRPFFLFLIIIFIIVFIGLLTPARDLINFHIDDLKSRLFYKFNSPDQVVFVPQESSGSGGLNVAGANDLAGEIPVEPTISITPTNPNTPLDLATETSKITILTAKSTVRPSQTVTFTPTATEIPLPSSASIDGVKYEDQHGIWNYCAPTNLSMAMTFWGWKGDRLVAGSWLKPFDKDKNVMFYEMENFVAENSELRSIVRPGGTPEVMKRLIASGFPVLIEKGAYMQEVSGRLSWMGHYNVVTGYDDEKEEWTVQDSYYTPDYIVSYDLLFDEWKSFNFQFMIVYPGDKEAELYGLLGPYTNQDWAKENALKVADEQIKSATDDESWFFAYFNRGSTQIELNDFYGAAQSYDMAFEYYALLDTSTRPYRIVWYQTGPYYAYYYSGRYNDVISLATMTLASTQEPYLEESYYWRAMAEVALQEFKDAESDLRTCLDIHEGFTACQSLLTEIGLQ